MKKNTLYAINKRNKNAFIPIGRTYAEGSWLGISKENNPFSKQNVDAAFSKEGFSSVFKKEGLKTAPKGMAGDLLNLGATVVGGVANKAISGGLSSGAGKAITGLGTTAGSIIGKANPLLGAAVTVGANIIGGGINRLGGTATDAAKVAANEAGTSYLNNFVSNASTFDDIRGPEAQAAIQDAYKSGALRKGWAESRNNEARRRRAEAQLFALNSVYNNADNLVNDQYSNAAYNYAAFGGPLNFSSGALGLMQQDKYFNAINNRSNVLTKNPLPQIPNTYDGGGALKMALLDNFGKDPLAAVMQYKQGLQALAEAEEQRAVEAEKEAQYADMQKKMIELETQNNDLQALVNSMPKQELFSSNNDNTDNTSSPSPSSSSHSFSAVEVPKNKKQVWNYIEEQLKKTGKFSDVQIEGIKRNINRESGFNYDIYGDSGKAYGLGQWHGSRQPKDRSLEGQTKHLIDTILTFGGENWVGKDNYNKFFSARTPEEAHYYLARGYERPAAWVMDNLKKEYDRSMRNYAFGGELGTNGTDWTNGLMYIDTGGSHETNPLGGVPVGVDEEGVPNLVEEGETIFNNYVFSNRMKIPKEALRELGLGGYMKKGITFADASKKLSQESEQRPNDPISKAGLEEGLNLLAQIQETERMRQQIRKYMESENVAALGGKLGNKFDEGGDKYNPYAYDKNWGDFKYFNPQTGKYDKEYLNFAKNINEDWVRRILNGAYGSMARYNAKNKGTVLSPETVARLATDRKYSDMHKAMAAAYEDSLKGLNPKTGKIETPVQDNTFLSPLQLPDATATPNDAQGYWGPGAGGKTFFESANETDFTGLPAVDWQGNPTGYTPNTPVYLPEGMSLENMSQEELDAVVAASRKAEKEYPAIKEARGRAQQAQEDEKEHLYPTWMRYAPVFGAGVMTLTDLLGLTNKPDYTYANKLEAAANRAGFAPNVRYSPIGDYLTYRPMDIWYEQNRLNANARATDRQITNNASPISTKIAGLLASGYNNQIASGELYRKALEYNDAQRERVADFNRKTNMFNSQMGLEADMANARYQQQASQMGLSGLAQAAAMREAIDQRVGAARSLNLNNLLTSLGNIGRENFVLNQIDSDKAWAYGVDNRGGSYYKGNKSSKRTSKTTGNV